MASDLVSGGLASYPKVAYYDLSSYEYIYFNRQRGDRGPVARKHYDALV